MMEKIKKNMKPTLVLGAICIIVAALLAAVNLIAAPEIEANRIAEITKSLTEVMPEGEFAAEPDKLKDGAPETVKAVYTDKKGGGYVFVLETKTEYTKGENMGITVAIDNSGKVLNVKLTSYSESKDFGKDYPGSYIGLDADGVASAPLVSGVTYSSSALRSAIYDALKYIGAASGDISTPESGEKPEITLLRPEEEVIAEIKALTGATTVEDVTPDKKYRPYNMPKLYKLDGDFGYAAYLATLGWGNYPVSEGIAYVDKNGDVKALKMLRWTPGYDKELFDAPPPFTDAIVESYIGKDFWHIDEAELVTSATGTSTDFKNAVADALRYITVNCIARTDAKVLQLLHDFVPYATGFEQMSLDGQPETVKRLYKVEGANIKGGRVAHVIVPGDYTPVATEALVYYDNGGNIVDVEILVWNVGHGVEAGDFADGFIGKDKGSVGKTELVSGATGTSQDFRDEMEKVLPSKALTTVIGTVLLSLAFIGFIAALIYFKRRNRAK